MATWQQITPKWVAAVYDVQYTALDEELPRACGGRAGAQLTFPAVTPAMTQLTSHFQGRNAHCSFGRKRPTCWEAGRLMATRGCLVDGWWSDGWGSGWDHGRLNPSEAEWGQSQTPGLEGRPTSLQYCSQWPPPPSPCSPWSFTDHLFSTPLKEFLYPNRNGVFSSVTLEKHHLHPSSFPRL